MYPRRQMENMICYLITFMFFSSNVFHLSRMLNFPELCGVSTVIFPPLFANILQLGIFVNLDNGLLPNPEASEIVSSTLLNNLVTVERIKAVLLQGYAPGYCHKCYDSI